MVTATNHFMLARSIPLLKGEQLCDFLANMDQGEQEALDLESKSYDEKLNSFEEEYNFQLKGSATTAGLGALSAAGGFELFKKKDTDFGMFLYMMAHREPYGLFQNRPHKNFTFLVFPVFHFKKF